MPSPSLLASVEVPASSANLGSGFDCFALALSLKLRAELFRGDEPGILLEAHGEGAPAENADPEENLVIRAFRAGLRTAGGARVGSGAWRIEVASMIPAARGLGSSAAAIVAGLLLGATVGRRSPDADELMALATDLEGHADNVAAAIFGGITLAVTNRQVPATVRRFRVPESWIPVVFITKAESRTSDMRGVLPPTVPFADAVAQAARSALLATAVATGDVALLRLAMDDRLHQPYRLPRLPDSALLETAGRQDPDDAAMDALAQMPERLGRVALVVAAQAHDHAHRVRHADDPRADRRSFAFQPSINSVHQL